MTTTTPPRPSRRIDVVLDAIDEALRAYDAFRADSTPDPRRDES